MIALEYHDVIETANFDASGFPGGSANSYKMALADFRAHLEVLGRGPGVGVDVRGPLPEGRRTVLLTFDDGGSSAVAPTADILDEHRLVGHFFMTTGQLGAPGFCTAEQLRELASRGHVVGSHSHTHPTRMAMLSDAELREEWRLSTGILTDVLGARPEVASVPGGYYSRRVAMAAAEVGIRWLFTSEPVVRTTRVGQCTILGRYTLRRQSPPQEVRSLTAPLGAARARQWLIWNTKKAVKRVGGQAYLKLRSRIFEGTS